MTPEQIEGLVTALRVSCSFSDHRSAKEISELAAATIYQLSARIAEQDKELAELRAALYDEQHGISFSLRDQAMQEKDAQIVKMREALERSDLAIDAAIEQSEKIKDASLVYGFRVTLAIVRAALSAIPSERSKT